MSDFRHNACHTKFEDYFDKFIFSRPFHSLFFLRTGVNQELTVVNSQHEFVGVG